MLTIAANPKRLGAKVGITAVLHTCDSALTHHLHVHMIVTGVGNSPDGLRWIASQPDCLVPVKVHSALFRGRMLGTLIDAHAAAVSSCSPHQAHNAAGAQHWRWKRAADPTNVLVRRDNSRAEAAHCLYGSS